jgi:large subunit ribosomal protein L25
MELRKVAATVRQATGKGENGRLRRTGRIPAVAYGRGQPARSLTVAPADLQAVLASEHGRNTVIELAVDEKEKLTVLLRDYQHHPVTRAFLHADFVQISLDQPVDVEIPLETTGKAAGVVKGGILRQVFRKIPVRCLPNLIPVKIVHDVTALELDGHVAAKDLGLPNGVEARLPPGQTVIAVVTEKQAPDEGEEDAQKAAAAAAAGAAGAAAAGDKAAAPAGDKAAEKGAEKKPEKK